METGALLSMLFNEFATGLIIVQNSRIKFINARMAGLLGYDVEELRDKPLHILCSPAPLLIYGEGLFAGQNRQYRQVELKHKEGTPLPAMLSTMQTGGRNDKEFLVILEYNEILKLRQDLTLLASMFNDSSQAICMTALDGTIMSWNRAATGIFGYSNDEVVGRNISILMPPDLNQSLVNRVLRGEDVEKQRTFLWTKPGLLVNIELNVSPVKASENDLIGLAWFYRDITLDRQAEKRLIYQARLLEAVNDAIAVADFNGNITYWNQGAERLFGRPAQEMLGKKHSIIFNYGETENIYDNMNEVAPGIWEGHRQIRTSGGVSKYVRISVRVLYDENNQPDLLVAVVTDISELVESRLSAEEAVRSKTEFLANISHEIRTPINGVLGFADLLDQTDLSGEKKLYLQAIKQNAAQLLELINDILDLSRIEMNSLFIDRVNFNLREMIEQCVQSYKALIKSKNLNFSLDISPEVREYYSGDSKRIRQVLNNILANAVKFTSAGGIKIEVSVKPAEEKRNIIVLNIAVIDTGIGITADRLPYIFEPFTQADSSTTRKYGGTGLGLAISKRLVDLMKGRIFVESVPGKGSKFTVQLPLTPGSSLMSPQYREIDKTMKTGSRKVLILSHDQIIIEKLFSFLEDTIYEPINITRGKNLKSMLIFYQPVLVIIDLDSIPEEKRVIINDINTAHQNIPLLLLSTQEKNTIPEKYRQNLLLPREVKKQDIMRLLPHEHCKSLQRLKNRVILAVTNKINQMLIKNILSNMGYQVDICATAAAVRELLNKERYDLMLADMELLGMEEHMFFDWIKLSSPHMPVIGLRNNANQFYEGIDDYLDKPMSTQSILVAVENTLRRLGGEVK